MTRALIISRSRTVGLIVYLVRFLWVYQGRQQSEFLFLLFLVLILVQKFGGTIF